MKYVVATEKAPKAIGPYSQAIIDEATLTSRTLYVSGQLGIDPATGALAEGGIEAQARQSLTNIKNILEAAGMSMACVVKTTCMLADIADFARFNEVYASFFDGVADPARSAFAVKALPKGALVEIEAIARG